MIVRRPNGFAPGSRLRVNPDRQPAFALAELSYKEFDEVLGAVRRLVSGTRAIEDVDLNPPHRADAFTVDVTELEQRTSAAVAALRQLASDLGQQLGQPDADDLEALRTSMLRAATYGVAAPCRSRQRAQKRPTARH